MIQVICDNCGNPVNPQLMGMIVSPMNEDGNHDEFHLCKSCYEVAVRAIFDGE